MSAASVNIYETISFRYGNNLLAWSAELSDMAHAWAVKLAERGRILYPEIPGNICSCLPIIIISRYR